MQLAKSRLWEILLRQTTQFLQLKNANAREIKGMEGEPTDEDT